MNLKPSTAAEPVSVLPLIASYAAGAVMLAVAMAAFLHDGPKADNGWMKLFVLLFFPGLFAQAACRRGIEQLVAQERAPRGLAFLGMWVTFGSMLLLYPGIYLRHVF